MGGETQWHPRALRLPPADGVSAFAIVARVHRGRFQDRSADQTEHLSYVRHCFCGKTYGHRDRETVLKALLPGAQLDLEGGLHGTVGDSGNAALAGLRRKGAWHLTGYLVLSFSREHETSVVAGCGCECARREGGEWGGGDIQGGERCTGRVGRRSAGPH